MELVFHGIHWQVDQSCGSLAEDVLKKFPGLLETDDCELIKKTSGRRTVYRLKARYPGLPYNLFIKTSSKPGFIKRIKYLFRPSRTLREWDMSKAQRKLDLPAARALALGEEKRFGLRNFGAIIFEYLGEHEPLDRYFLKNFVDVEISPDRDELIVRFAVLVRKLHDAGVYQRDFKPDSIMVSGTREGLDFRMVDLESARYTKRTLNREERIRNLANIFYTFEGVFSPRDKRKFLEKYFEQDDLSDNGLQKIHLEIFRLAESLARKWAWKLRSWVRTQNELYYNFSHGRRRVYMHESMPESELRRIVDEIEEIGDKEIKVLRKREEEPSRMIIRECRPAFHIRYRSLVGGALLGFENTTVLRHRGVPYLKVRAAVQRQFMGGFRRGHVVIELPSALSGIREAWQIQKTDEKKSRMFLEGLGEFISGIGKIGLRSSLSPDKTIRVFLKEDATPEFLIDHPETLFLPKSGSESSGMDLISEITGIMGLGEEDKNILNRLFIDS